MRVTTGALGLSGLTSARFKERGLTKHPEELPVRVELAIPGVQKKVQVTLVSVFSHCLPKALTQESLNI